MSDVIHRQPEAPSTLPSSVVLPHLLTLHKAGMSPTEIARRAGVSPSGIHYMLARRWPSIRYETCLAILALHPPSAPSPTMRVDAGPSRRRLQALSVLGYSMSSVGSMIGYGRSYVTEALKRPMVTQATAETIATFYSKTAFREPRFGSPGDRSRAMSRRARLRDKGWLGPLDWEDIEAGVPAAWLDDEEDGGEGVLLIDEIAIDHALSGFDIHLARADAEEAIRRAFDGGATKAEIAQLLGLDLQDVKRVLASRLRERARLDPVDDEPIGSALHPASSGNEVGAPPLSLMEAGRAQASESRAA